MPAAAPLIASDQELVELMNTMRGADSVELKATVPLTAQRATFLSLGLDPLDGQIRLVHFFDTPDLALEQAGVVVRARRSQGRPDDTVVKLRPIEPSDIPAALRESPDFFVEVDATPTTHVCSGSLKGQARRPIRDVLEGGGSVRKLLTKQQRALYADRAPAGIELDDLVVLGPVFVVKLKGRAHGFDRRMVAELWLYPDGTRIAELSTKCPPAEAFQVAAEVRASLARLGITLAEDQQTKTRKALEFFSANPDPAPAPAA